MRVLFVAAVCGVCSGFFFFAEPAAGQQTPYRKIKTINTSVVDVNGISSYFVSRDFSQLQRRRLLDFGKRAVEIFGVSERFRFIDSEKMEDIKEARYIDRPWFAVLGISKDVSETPAKWASVFDRAENLSSEIIEQQRHRGETERGVYTDTIWFYGSREKRILHCEIDILYQLTPDKSAQSFAFVLSISTASPTKILDYCVVHAIFVRMGVELRLSAVNLEKLGVSVDEIEMESIVEKSIIEELREYLK